MWVYQGNQEQGRPAPPCAAEPARPAAQTPPKQDAPPPAAPATPPAQDTSPPRPARALPAGAPPRRKSGGELPRDSLLLAASYLFGTLLAGVMLAG